MSRQSVLDAADRVAVRDLLSIAVLQYTISESRKHTRVEALTKLLRDQFSDLPHVQNQINQIEANLQKEKET
jgi:hypothetical protein